MAEEVEDEAVVDSWEDFEENPDVLDQQLKMMSIKNEKPLEKVGETLMLSEEDSQRSNPFSSQEPKIMILRRPQKPPVELPNGIVPQKQKQPVKSLQQRQAEYAEARLRILGDSGSPTEEMKMKPLQHKPLDQRNCESSLMMQGNPANSVYLPDNTQSSISLSDGTKPIAFIKPPPSSVNVVRAPRGPTSHQLGFQHRPGTNHPS